MTQVMPKAPSQVWPAILAALAVALAVPASAGQNAPVASPADAARPAVTAGAAEGVVLQAAAAATEQAAQAAEQAAEQAVPAEQRVPSSNFKWAWGNTITYGLGFRVQDRDERIIGIAAGGTGWSVNGDDGNQNYGTGLFTNAVKLTSELELSYKNVGGFVRAFGFVDFENEYGDRERTELTGGAQKRVGARAEIRDAFGYVRGNAGRSARGLAGDQLGREHVHPGRHQRHQPPGRQRAARARVRAARRAAARRRREGQREAVQGPDRSRGSTSTPGKI